MYINHQFKNTAEKMKVRIIIFLLQRKIRLTIKVEWLGAHPWKYRMNAQKAEVMCYLTNHHPCIYFSKFSVLSSYLFPWSFYLSLSSIPTSFIVKVSVFECYKEWEVSSTFGKNFLQNVIKSLAEMKKYWKILI